MGIFVEFEKEAYQAAERIGLKCAVKAYYNKDLQYNAALFTFAAGGELVQIETGFPEICSNSCIKSWAKTCLIEAITGVVNQDKLNTGALKQGMEKGGGYV